MPTDEQIFAAMEEASFAAKRHELIRLSSGWMVRTLDRCLVPTVEFMGVDVPPISNCIPADAKITDKYFDSVEEAGHYRKLLMVTDIVTAALTLKHGYNPEEE